MYGYMGKILRVDLSKGSIDAMPIADYEDWGGGHGMGSAIFFDIMVRERKLDLEKIDGFHPANVVTIMTSPLSGTLVPAASCRTEVQGIGVQSYPIGWFTRSNFGGRFSPQLKFAGWDGIVIEGRSQSPVRHPLLLDDGADGPADCRTDSLRVLSHSQRGPSRHHQRHDRVPSPDARLRDGGRRRLRAGRVVSGDRDCPRQSPGCFFGFDERHLSSVRQPTPSRDA